MIPIVILLLSFKYPIVPPIPGSLCTPRDPDFKEYRYPEKIAYCKRNVTTQRKIDICARDGVYNRRHYTVDHFIPLSMGGSNHDDNLWCQHEDLAVTGLEYNLYRKMYRGDIGQSNAIRIIKKAKLNPPFYIQK